MCFFLSQPPLKKHFCFVFLSMPKCWRNQNKAVKRKCAIQESVRIYCFMVYIQYSVLFCSFKITLFCIFFSTPSPSGAIMKLAVPHRPERNTGRNITFCREESLSRTPVTEFISTWTTIHLDREVINLIGFCLLTQWIPWPWLSSAGPEMLRSSPWRRHLNVPELHCFSGGTLMYRWRYLPYSWCIVTPFGGGVDFHIYIKSIQVSVFMGWCCTSYTQDWHQNKRRHLISCSSQYYQNDFFLKSFRIKRAL